LQRQVYPLLGECFVTDIWPFGTSQHEQNITELVSRIQSNAKRYVALFSEVVDKLMPVPTKDISEHDEVIDVILHQRRERNERMEATQDGFPSHLLRR
jgi:DNA replication licensing factor MCM7